MDAVIRRIFSLLQADLDWLAAEGKRRKISAAAVLRALIAKARGRGSL